MGRPMGMGGHNPPKRHPRKTRQLFIANGGMPFQNMFWNALEQRRTARNTLEQLRTHSTTLLWTSANFRFFEGRGGGEDLSEQLAILLLAPFGLQAGR